MNGYEPWTRNQEYHGINSYHFFGQNKMAKILSFISLNFKLCVCVCEQEEKKGRENFPYPLERIVISIRWDVC